MRDPKYEAGLNHTRLHSGCQVEHFTYNNNGLQICQPMLGDY